MINSLRNQKAATPREIFWLINLEGKLYFLYHNERSNKIPKDFGKLNCFVLTGLLSTCSRFVNGIGNNIIGLLLLLNNIGFHHLLDACLKKLRTFSKKRSGMGDSFWIKLHNLYRVSCKLLIFETWFNICKSKRSCLVKAYSKTLIFSSICKSFENESSYRNYSEVTWLYLYNSINRTF